MSQQFRRMRLDEFLPQAPGILDGIAARGETVLVEHNGRLFTLSAYSAYRKRATAKPQPPNMQDLLWSYARSNGVDLTMNGASPAKIAEEPSKFAPRRTSRNGPEPSGKPSE